MQLCLLTEFKARVHTLCFYYFPTFSLRASSREEADNPASVESSGSESGDDVWSQEPPQKRVSEPSQQKRNIAKRKRDIGEACVGEGPTKRHKEAETPGPPCKCPRKCYDMIGAYQIKVIFNNYWKMADHDAQTQYLGSLVSTRDVKNCRAGPDKTRRKLYVYSVPVIDTRFIVCKVAFCNIHGINAQRVLHAMNQMQETGGVPADTCSTVRSIDEIPDDSLQLVHDHIKTLPTCSTHHSQPKSPRQVFLSPGYSQKACYDHYVKMCKKKGVTDKMVKLEEYKSVMRSCNINLNPRKCDICKTCEYLKSELRGAKIYDSGGRMQMLKLDKYHHLSRATAVRRIMNAFQDKSADPAVAGVAVDMQKTLTMPRLTTGVHPRKQKIWTYSFCVHNLKESTTNVYVWNEATARRGASEIGSCLINYVNNYIPDSVNKFFIFSDIHCRLTKNIDLSLLLLRWVQSGRFTSIRQCSLLPGHSSMPRDQDFGDLEKVIKGKEIYTTPHYVSLLKKVRQSNPFTVVEMRTDDFVDLEPLQRLHSETSTSQKTFRNCVMLTYKGNYKQGMGIMMHSQNIQKLQLQKGMRAAFDQSKFNLPAVHLPIKYPGGVKLPPEKLDDLNHLLQFVPAKHSGFYTDLFAAQALMGGREGTAQDDPKDSSLDL